MARIRVCGVCYKPVRECICDDEPSGPEDSSGDEDEDAA